MSDIWSRKYQEYGGRCAYCGKHLFMELDTYMGSTLDHIIPQKAGEPESDADWQDRNLAEDFTAIEPTGEIKTKSEAVAMRRSGAVKFESIVVLDRQVRVYGDTAIVITRSNIKAHIFGHDIEGESWLTAVWVKRNGQWKEVASQSTSIPKK